MSAFYLVYAIAGFLMGFFWTQVYATFAAPFLGIGLTYGLSRYFDIDVSVAGYLFPVIVTTSMTAAGVKAADYR
jgi:small basic protein